MQVRILEHCHSFLKKKEILDDVALIFFFRRLLILKNKLFHNYGDIN